jgi:hypothetical protein
MSAQGRPETNLGLPDRVRSTFNSGRFAGLEQSSDFDSDVPGAVTRSCRPSKVDL